MGRWEPDAKNIGPNEHLGRRLFGEPLLIGAQDQVPPNRLRLDHFMEKRDKGEVSLDRMGQSGIDKRVRNYLMPRALRAAQGFKEPKLFLGWAVAKVKTLTKPPHGEPVELVASPIAGAEPEDNVYHAHAIPGSRDYYHMALHLLYLFSEHGTVEAFDTDLKANNNTPPPNEQSKSA
jgi:hypothetical protein